MVERRLFWKRRAPQGQARGLSAPGGGVPRRARSLHPRREGCDRAPVRRWHPGAGRAAPRLDRAVCRGTGGEEAGQVLGQGNGDHRQHHRRRAGQVVAAPPYRPAAAALRSRAFLAASLTALLAALLAWPAARLVAPPAPAAGTAPEGTPARTRGNGPPAARGQ